ncbi:hypothetical protein ANRL3_01509 [Anaerolineae bacterium]|nr:hypothetical protein ANRL3_01509 [Anaerolineae bacterium]
MLTYRVRPRVIKFDPGTKIHCPAQASVDFVFAPDQAFGVESGGGRTAVRGVAGTVTMDRRTGQYFIESSPPLAPLELTIRESDTLVNVVGNKLTISKTVNSEHELTEIIEAIYYILPLLMATDLADPPIIINVSGVVNDRAFGWNLAEWKANFITTTQEKQTQYIATAWQRLHASNVSQNARLIAALHYFHVAARLDRVSSVPGEFLSESLLNYTKVLEVMFSPSTDIVRQNLLRFGFSSDEIERDFIPAMILRSKIDIAHVSLALFDTKQLSVLHRYADRAEGQFRVLLSRALTQSDKGTLALPEYEIHAADAEIVRIIERMADSLEALGDRP